MIGAETRILSSLNEFERKFALPVQRIAEVLAVKMVARIRLGVGAQGPLSPLGAFSVDSGSPTGRQRFWVRPGRPQPTGDGWLATHKTGAKAGWALYRNYAAYARLVGHGAPRDLSETGAFLDSIGPRVLSPSHAKVAPYGTHRGPSGLAISNTSLGYADSKREPLPLLYPTAEEIREAAAITFEEVDGQALEAAATAGIGTQARQQVASFNRRASKLLAARI